MHERARDVVVAARGQRREGDGQDGVPPHRRTHVRAYGTAVDGGSVGSV